MKYRLIKYIQGSKVWYEIQRYIEFNWFGRVYYGYDGYWELCSETRISYDLRSKDYLRYDDVEIARVKFSEVEETYLNNKCEIKKEILKEV